VAATPRLGCDAAGEAALPDCSAREPRTAASVVRQSGAAFATAVLFRRRGPAPSARGQTGPATLKDLGGGR